MRGKGEKHVEARLMQEVTQGWVKHERKTIKEAQEHTHSNWRIWYHWKLVMMQVYFGKRELLDQQGIVLQKYKGWSPLRRKDEVGISPCRLCWLLPCWNTSLEYLEECLGVEVDHSMKVTLAITTRSHNEGGAIAVAVLDVTQGWQQNAFFHFPSLKFRHWLISIPLFLCYTIFLDE